MAPMEYWEPTAAILHRLRRWKPAAAALFSSCLPLLCFGSWSELAVLVAWAACSPILLWKNKMNQQPARTHPTLGPSFQEDRKDYNPTLEMVAKLTRCHPNND
ncbi:hypothetical protein KSP40_PGU011241 [Platanthera guangdongensis]|uniref:Uncharacterized protein n=1 Tax=Platanthera guangdongensis TaxID=2320717 RepID=A0ABR2LQJ6_9ASPA